MRANNIAVKLKPKKLQIGGTSDRTAGLYNKTLRILDNTTPHEDLIPSVEPPVLLRQSGPAQAPTTQLNTSLNQLSNTAFNQVPGLTGLQKPGGQPTNPNIGAGVAAGVGIAGAALSGAGELMDSLRKSGPVNAWGLESQTTRGAKSVVASSALKSAGKGAAAGASIGSIIPGWGTAVGAAVGGLIGGVTGLLKGRKKVKDAAKNYKDNTQAAYESYNQKANAQQYAALAKCGAKLSVMHKIKSSKKDAISRKDRKFKAGGKLNAVGEVNIIPSGTLHNENNNLGNKDKGLPIVDKDGAKIFEVEREELILRLKTTKDVEDLVSKYKKSNNSKHLVDLGKLLSKEITTNTHDFSGRYGMEVK